MGFPERESHGARRETNGGTGSPYGDIYAGKFSSKQVCTVATTCAKTCFFCATSGDSSPSWPLHNSACSNVFPSRIFLLLFSLSLQGFHAQTARNAPCGHSFLLR